MSAPVTDARGLLAAHAGLPWAGELVDDAALSARLGLPAHATYARIKPGRSLVVAWQSAAEPRARGWAAVLRDTDKRDNAVRRAAKVGAALVEHEAGEAFLLSGTVEADPELAKELALVGQSPLGRAASTILRYNPRRRVVARVEAPGGPQVLRAQVGPAGPLVQATHAWHRLGAPVLPTSALAPGLETTVTPWWGIGNLFDVPDPLAAQRAGGAVARVHASPAPGVAAGPRATDVADTVARVAPWLTDRLTRLATAIGEWRGGGRAVHLHGDLSPDQVLVNEGGHLRFIDFDRATVGAAGHDVGSWVAACRLEGSADLAEAFLDGYRSGGAPPTPGLAAWVAHSVLSRALEPYRTLHPEWPDLVENRVRLAEEAVER